MKIGICDDQKEYREILAEYCNQYFYEKKIGYEIFLYDSGEKFATQRSEKLDILLLDIEMNELDGIRIKEQLRKEKEDIRILFVSSHEEMMPEAFGKGVYGFLSKPVSYHIFQKKMDSIVEDIKDQERYIIVEEAAGKERIYLQDILYFKSDRKYCEIYRRKKEGYLLSNKPIHEWQEELEKYGFGKCHRSYLVNFLYVDKIDKEILLQNGDKIPVSRQNKKKIQEDYRDFIWEKGR